MAINMCQRGDCTMRVTFGNTVSEAVRHSLQS